MGAIVAFALTAVTLNLVYGVALYRARRIHPFTSGHVITTVTALAAVLAATGVRSRYPVGGWVMAHVLALLIVVVNADLRSAFGAFRDMGVARQ
jgi:hypothetical protein